MTTMQLCQWLIVHISCCRQAWIILSYLSTLNVLQSGFVQPRGNASIWISSHLLCSSSDMKSQWPAASPQNTCLGFCSDEIQTSPFKKKIKNETSNTSTTHLKLLSHWRIVMIQCRGDTADETRQQWEDSGLRCTYQSYVREPEPRWIDGFCSSCLFCQLRCCPFDREAKLT